MNIQNNNTSTSNEKRDFSIIKFLLSIPVLLLKAIYILPFFLFILWLFQLLYFPEIETLKSVIAKPSTDTAQNDKNIFRTILKQKDPVGKGHFHMIDEYISQSEPNPPLCLTCHGSYPHSKEKKVRSLLNFHTGFLACSVCHARKKIEDTDIFFTWVDRKSGNVIDSTEGEYGKYTAKIFPIRMTDGTHKRIFKPIREKAAQEYLKLKDKYTPDQTAQAKIKLHENITTKPVFCSDCHQKDGYMDFSKLGFSEKRTNHLISTEVVGMIEKYKTFYLPSEIDFGAD